MVRKEDLVVCCSKERGCNWKYTAVSSLQYTWNGVMAFKLNKINNE